MSQQLAQHVTLPHVEESMPQHREFEDLDMGMRVATYTHPIAYVEFNTGMFWKHGLKTEQEFRDWWNKGRRNGTNSTDVYWTGWGAWKKDGGGLG